MRAQYLSPGHGGSENGSGHLRHRLDRWNLSLSSAVSEIHRPTQRTGDGKALPHQLHRRHEERLSIGYDQGDIVSRASGSHAKVMARNQDTIQNIRLWDSRPLLQT